MDFDKHRGWNKRGGWNIFMKSVNVEVGIFFCGGGKFSKSVSLGSTFIRELRVGRQKAVGRWPLVESPYSVT